jgi:hypothetical protein
MSSYNVVADHDINLGDEVVMTYVFFHTSLYGMTKDKIYTVIALHNDLVSIINDKGQPDWIHYSHFEKPLKKTTEEA